jgi:transposase
VVLDGKVRVELVRRVRAATSTQRDAVRARIILECAEGGSANDVAARVGVSSRAVERWRGRVQRRGLDGLADAPRPGRKPKFGSVTRLELTALACEPQRRTIEELAAEAVKRGVVQSISWSSYQRILSNVDLRPHLVEGWIHSPDPQFKEKVTAITDLYLHPPADSVVLCIDEKPGMQALQRRFPDRAPAPGRRRRREFEYKRHGTQTLLCAFEVQTGRVVATCGERRTAEDLVRFMETVAAAYPTGAVHVVWDNLNIHFDGNDHRWTAFNKRHAQRFVFHYTPKHASWVNQVECFFSILERKCLRDASFSSTTELREAVVSFIGHWNEHPRPFRWTFRGYPLQTGVKLAEAA